MSLAARPELSGSSAAASSAAVAGAVDELARFAADLDYAGLPAPVRERLALMLTDLWGVAAAGGRTPEQQALCTAWQAGPGDSPVLGAGFTSTPETAAFLNAVAACQLELDEGNKHAQGHPAVHVVFAAMAAVQLESRPVTGTEFLTAVAAGYEVAARFGRAFTRHPGWHTHGHWGATGAACAAALIRRLPVERIAAAIDAAAGLAQVASWDMVLGGQYTRNLWAAGANLAGLNAARLAAAGLTENDGAAGMSLGTLAGSLEPGLLVNGLGRDWLLTQGYAKLHSSCSYTHGAVDLALELRPEHVIPEDISFVQVHTHSLAAPLFPGSGTGAPRNRLAAMFDFPFVVANALTAGEISPASMAPDAPGFDAARQLAARVSVAADPAYDRLLPAQRRTRLEIRFTDGTVRAAESPNPRGDVDHFPLDRTGVGTKLTALIGAGPASRLDTAVRSLPDTDDAKAALNILRTLMTSPEGDTQ
ncbi:MmgE/PrpD family protein [Arthrobacter zhangbolii]|uniref:MmgE/PrpD family protein n=1 Tax=Arthrobacter zhangbolii TaxID=2886936 RepID=A0A9X1M9C4_9MICC|nr:MmgE/PrpD family protein [Arthrobacter zhangbolii]MCC3273290.1 MmgE/PrpD family protein [Arthrobacter zhangbolii]MCC3295918.1 MmgE/PrpD family protein [Arthrobacter zhangbolii]UON92727.1 MmgE/PrpD family protein [Arthrobacter zhangbolii]